MRVERTPQGRNNYNDQTDIEFIEDFSYMDDESDKQHDKFANSKDSAAKSD